MRGFFSITGRWYRNVTLATPPLLAGLLLWQASPLTWTDAALTPFYFLAMNLIEYVLHRWPMHRPGSLLYDHTRIHHRAFHAGHLYVECDDDNFSAVTPLYVCALVLIGIAPAAGLLGWRDGLFLMGFGAAYYFVEELLHYLAHVGRFGRHHLRHHAYAGWNYNINFPVFDWVFETLYRPVERH